MSAAIAVWPSASAHCRALRPFSSSSSVSALARSRACTHTPCPPAAATIRPVKPLLAFRSGLAGCCSSRSRMERWPRNAASMSAVTPRPVGKSTLAPRSSSSLTISNWPPVTAACSRAEVVVRPSSVRTGQSSSTGSDAGELITADSPASSGAAGEVAVCCCGATCCRMSSAVAMWPLASACCRGVWPSSSSSSVLALARSSAFTHASCPWSGLAECCRRTSTMERWPWYAASMSAVRPSLPGKSTLAPRSSSSLAISSWPPVAAACSRATVGVRTHDGHRSSVETEMSASASPPFPSHLTTFCSSPRPADLSISMGSEDTGGAAGAAAAGFGGTACCWMSSAVVGWPWTSAHCGAVRPSSLISWVFAPASSRAMHPSILLGWPCTRACSRSCATVLGHSGPSRLLRGSQSSALV
eukprot:scaffold37045_cov62-Phaeocystis_antarctica.AAC.3